MSFFQRLKKSENTSESKSDIEMSSAAGSAPGSAAGSATDVGKDNGPGLPTHNHNGHKITKGIKPEGESGRKGFHPKHFLKVSWTSTSDVSRAVNVLWPVVPAAIAVRYSLPDHHLLIFILNYIAMVPCANMVGFAGQEFARKLPKVAGVLIETTLGSIVELVMFIVLLKKKEFAVIQAAILGSVLATLLLCLGMCFFIGGMKRDEQEFSEVVSEVGSGLLLMAGLGLSIPTAFRYSLDGVENETPGDLDARTLHVSRITAIMLWISYATYLWFQMHTHHGIYDALLEEDEERDTDRQKDLKKPKLTLTECLIALSVSITLVTIIAISLVEQISSIVSSRGISDSFMGLILVPLVEKAAEHLTAVDEAYDNQMNYALSHILGATLQTALFNAPLAVIVGWGMGVQMDFTFQQFDIIVLMLSILVVGNFLRDQKSNYLEGALCVLTYIIVAIAAYYYPTVVRNPIDGEPIVERIVAQSIGLA